MKEMAKRQQEKYGWEFLFLGANIDAMETDMGIAPQQTANYHSDSEGTALNYEGLSDTVCAVRAGAPLGTGRKEHIDRDYEKRKTRRG